MRIVAARVRRLVRVLPPGTVSVAGGLVVSGLTAYAFLTIASRALGPTRYTPLGLLWAIVFVAAPGLFLPLEQEVGRALVARRVRGIGGRPVIRKAAIAGGALAVIVVVAAAAAERPLIDRIFDGEGMLLVGFVAAVFVYSVYFLARGTLAGNGRFGAYGTLLGVEGLTRVAAAACLAALGAHAVGAYGLAISLPCLIGMAVALRGQRGLATAGPEAKWAELSTALGYLLAGWLLAQLLAYSGVLAVKLLAPASDSGAGGRFLNGLIIARIPLFFFQAVLASLLPRLAAQATAGHLREFRHGFERLLVMVGGVAAVAVVGYFALGPFVLRVLFGKSYELGHLDMALLAAATGIYMVALALAQALIALAGHAQVAVGWLVGMVAFLAVVAPTSGLFLRVEVGLAVASVASACVMGMFLLRRLAAVLGPSRDENTAFVAEPPVA